MTRQKIISLEGGDGSGKTTLIKKIEKYFIDKEIPYMITREPGGVRISEAIREIILDTRYTEMDYKTEALLYAAARRQHLTEKVIPQLDSGRVILFDRYVDSSVVYQGYVRGIGMEEVYRMNLFATEGFLPVLTLLLDVDPKEGIKRISENERHEDRLDLEGISFHQKVREGYLLLAKKYPDRIKIVDANGTPQAVYRQVEALLDAYLEEQ
ncbi:MAG: thymidylate kinase [delta proteobacterium ML8_F1]|nr:MAG: thymidylate kinase [delta proteobacterium ML8_F1]